MWNLFCDLNPESCGTGVIDWKYTVDPKLSYSENVEGLSFKYPQYQWTRPEEITARTYEREIVSEVKDLVDDFNYEVVKKYKLENLQGAEGRSERLSKKLEVCKVRPIRKPSIPGTYRVKKVKVKEHYRCLPRK